jgi:hypothetical protein
MVVPSGHVSGVPAWHSTMPQSALPGAATPLQSSVQRDTSVQ